LAQSDYFHSLWQEENMGKPKSAHKTTRTDNLIKAVWLMGISFQIWNTKDSKEKDWTSLMGNEKKKLLKACKVSRDFTPRNSRKNQKVMGGLLAVVQRH